MGKRARALGISNADVKRRHAHAVEIAQGVYRAARDLLDEDDSSPVPVWTMAALTYLGENAAPGIAKALGEDEPSAELVGDIAAYLTSGYLSMVTTFNPEHFEAWRSQADDAEMTARQAAQRLD